MKIENAINISDLFLIELDIKSANVPLDAIEKMFTDAGLEEGSFGVFKVTYADNLSEVYFDYPTDMTIEQARVFAEDAFVKANDKQEIVLKSAVDISDIVFEILKMPLRQVSLTHLIALFVKGGLEENQFRLSMSLYVDGRTTIGFIYPINKNDDQTRALVKDALIKGIERK